MRVYSVSFSNVTVSAAQDLFELNAVAGGPVYVQSLELFNVGADVGDAEEEMLRITVIRGHTTSGSGGTAPTPVAASSRDAAAVTTAEVNNTTIASAGTTATLWSGGWNIRVPFDKTWLLYPDADCRPRIDSGGTVHSRLVVRLVAAPADAVSMSGTLIFAES